MRLRRNAFKVGGALGLSRIISDARVMHAGRGAVVPAPRGFAAHGNSWWLNGAVRQRIIERVTAYGHCPIDSQSTTGPTSSPKCALGVDFAYDGESAPHVTNKTG